MDEENDNGGLRVIDGGSGEPEINEEELIKAENELRSKATELFKKIEFTYWDLGECLYSVYDGVPGGYRELMTGDGSRAKRQELFKKWGHKSFGDYCEKEIGIRKRSAENLRYAYYYFEIALHLPKEVKDQIKTLGRSKVYLLAGIAKEDDILTWIDKAKSMSVDLLKTEVKELRQNKEDSKLEGDYGAEDVDGIKEGPPQPEEMTHFQTSFYPAQQKTWEQAFDCAKSLSGSEKVGHNLELICQDFMANNGFTPDSNEDKIAYIRKVEKLLGVALIAIDPMTGESIHNTDLLWRLLEEKQAAPAETKTQLRVVEEE